jgi:hypothetical protein
MNCVIFLGFHCQSCEVDMKLIHTRGQLHSIAHYSHALYLLEGFYTLTLKMRAATGIFTMPFHVGTEENADIMIEVMLVIANIS